MVSFTVNIVSETEDRRVPIEVAGNIMVDIQVLFRHIGEYIIANELRLQEPVPKSLSDRFTLYVDRAGELIISASSERTETEGYGDLLADTITLFESTLDALGSGKGGYWVEDNFKDVIYRNQIVMDTVSLYMDIVDSVNFSLRYGSSQELKKFGNVDVKKLIQFIEDRDMSGDGAAAGRIVKIPSKSKQTRYELDLGGRRIKATFRSEDEAKKALSYGGAAIVAGKLTYSEKSELESVDDIFASAELTSAEFGRIIAASGDITLKEPVKADVKFDSGKWSVSDGTLGILSSKDSWDAAVAGFHDYFVFLCTEYLKKDDSELDDEEKEIKAELGRLVG